MSTAGGGWAKAPSFADDPRMRERLRERTAEDRREQLEGGLRPVECARCGACVLAKKNSPSHTSIQWTGAAAEQCPELAARARDGSTAHVESCPDLHESIAASIRDTRSAVEEQE
ncbi:hypothetical protein [Saccharopolyspora sp. NFXS83]|uniref:hypothetical protein n=1 Tax=Saccharopolyspora sp. NFXS83 TaxID=2993560 RepID=UPI002B05A779|nr:hypothetical protein [Saccharopolyspora sp. NFXS83]